MQLRRPRRLRERATAPITIAYVLAAVFLGSRGQVVARLLLGNAISPVASSSAEAILSAIASGTMALTAILFSLLFVAMQVSGSAFSPRLVRFLGRSPLLGHALGVFTGTFMYALFAIRTIDIQTGPGIDVSVIALAFAWLLASIAVLVRLVLRLRTLEIGDLLATLYEQTERAALRVYPSGGATERAPVAPRSSGTVILHTGRPRYLLGFDVERLVRVARDAGATIHLPIAIGDPVVVGDPLAIVVPADRAIDEAAVRDALWLGAERVIDNDPAYGIRLLVDVALRALSPAVNDPTTAVTVLDQLDGLLRMLSGRRIDDNRVVDANGTVRLVFEVRGWDELVALALTEIEEYGRDSRQVQRRLAALRDDLRRALSEPSCRPPAAD